MQPGFYTLYSVVKVRILLYKLSVFMTDVSTMIVISGQTGFSDGLPLPDFFSNPKAEKMQDKPNPKDSLLKII